MRPRAVTEIPRVAFFLADRRHPVDSSSPVWTRGLPSTAAGAPAPGATYGGYFKALAAFLGHCGWLPVRQALGAAPERIAIFLEKHGAFYHPARVEVDAGALAATLAVNVAVSPAGQTALAAEAERLEMLERRFGGGRLPRVHHCRTVTGDDGRPWPMFLAEWFAGFFEFHHSGGPPLSHRLSAWTPAGPQALDAGQARSLYRQVARVLTEYYDVITCEQILDWHHAAGDFILRPLQDDRIDLRLITVRRYGPLIPETRPDLAAVFFGAALFLVHTSLRMRLDRRDGVGPMVLAGPEAIAPTVEGIFEALAHKGHRGQIPGELAAALAAYLGGLSEADLQPMMSACIQQRPAGDPGKDLMAAGAAQHRVELQRALAQVRTPSPGHYIQR